MMLKKVKIMLFYIGIPKTKIQRETILGKAISICGLELLSLSKHW